MLVYIREAHAIDGAMPNPRGPLVEDPIDDGERREVASKCVQGLGLDEFTAVVDRIDDATNRAYGAWPDRLCLVGKDGRIAYAGRPGPAGFAPDELEAAIAIELARGEEGGGQAGEPKTDDPAALLHELVDLAAPKERAARAKELAALPIDVDTWIGAMRAFAPLVAASPGRARPTVPLWNGEAMEDTELWILAPETIDPQQPLALILQAHGTGASGEGQPEIWREVARAWPAVIVAPSESGANDGYRYSDRERELTLSAMRWARRQWRVDPDRIVLSGISRGGHLTWDLASRRPDRFAALAPMIGGPRLNPGQAQNNLRYVENLAPIPIRDLQGAQDDPRLVANLRIAFQRLRDAGARDAKLIEFEALGHGFEFGAVDWVEWLSGVRRDPRPERVVLRAARAGEGRSSWCEILAYDTSKVREEPALSFPAAEWEPLDETARRAKVQRLLDDCTARLDARWEAPGRIRIDTLLVKKLRLLLDDAMCDEKGQVVVVWNGKEYRRTPRRDAQVLLAEFAERFDPGFLPLRSVVLP